MSLQLNVVIEDSESRIRGVFFDLPSKQIILTTRTGEEQTLQAVQKTAEYIQDGTATYQPKGIEIKFTRTMLNKKAGRYTTYISDPAYSLYLLANLIPDCLTKKAYDQVAESIQNDPDIDLSGNENLDIKEIRKRKKEQVTDAGRAKTAGAVTPNPVEGRGR